MPANQHNVYQMWRPSNVLTKNSCLVLLIYNINYIILYIASFFLVDRGIHGYEVAVYLILLKLVYPGNYTILRGNHEISWMNRGFFLRECQLKFGKKPGTAAWRTLNQCFSMLPYAALINQNVLCCHGGFPRKLRSLEDIDTKIPKGLVNEHHNVLALQLVCTEMIP